MPFDVLGLVLRGQSRWFQKAILTGKAENWILLGWTMDPVSSYLNNVIACGESIEMPAMCIYMPVNCIYISKKLK